MIDTLNVMFYGILWIMTWPHMLPTKEHLNTQAIVQTLSVLLIFNKFKIFIF